MARQETQSLTDSEVWWTLDKAALHPGVTRATIEKYVREGLTAHWGRVHRAELLAEYGRRQANTRATRLKKSSAQLQGSASDH